jgi:hypothetical protein
MANLDPRIDAIRERYGLAASDFWELPQKKGTWLVKHAALELAAAKANITFDNPIIIEANSEAGVAVLSVAGMLGERREWATGEAAPKNNKNAYPWAMAEKRAKDRVILKLIGMHGLVYSEDEMDHAAPDVRAPEIERLSAYRGKQILNFENMQREIDTAPTVAILDNWELFYTKSAEPWMPKGWVPALVSRIMDRRKALTAKTNGAVADYEASATDRMEPAE